MLLHIGNTAASWITLDSRVVFFGVLLFLGVVTAIWGPLARSRRPLRRIAHFVVQLTVLAALLPSVLPYDHLIPTGHAEDHPGLHAAHCHESPGSCSDAPVSAGTGQFLASEPLLAAPALVVTLLVAATPLLRGRTTRPEIRPPLRTQSA